METNKLIAGIVAAAIAVIVLAGVLMPALSNATTTEDTFKNTGHFSMEKITSSDTASYVISWDVTKPNQVTVNDDTVTIDTGSASQLSLICGDDWIFRANITSGSISGVSYIIDSGTGGNASSAFTCTLNAGSMSATVDGTSKSESYTSAYIPYNDGSYVMKKSADTAYIKDDSDLFAMGLSSISYSGGTRQEGLKIVGTYDDLTISVWRPPTDVSLSSFSNITTDAAAVESNIDLYTIKQIDFVFTYTNADDSTTDTNLTYSYFIVPAEVTAERSVHLTDAMNVILNVIPLLIIVAVLLGVVAVFILRRE